MRADFNQDKAMQQLYALAAILIGLVFLISIGKLLLGTGRARYPYGRQETLFSKGERAFYDVLRIAVGNKWLIFAKVRLEDLVSVPIGVQDRMKWVNKVRQKHADFVLCSCDKISPVLVIELDDKSHDGEQQRRRDNEKTCVLEAAGLPQ
jgi:hypothetical protein